MTDARFPERLLSDRRLQRTSADHYRAYGNSLMYAVSNRTDGYLTADDFEAIPHFKPENADALVSADLWDVTEGGWIIRDYLITQTSRAQLEAAENARVKDAERKARERATKKGTAIAQAPESCNPVDSPADNRSEVSNPVDNPADNVGKARDRPETGKVLPAVPVEKAEIAIEPAYPTDARAIAWRQKIDAAGIKSVRQLAQDPQLTAEQARKMWLAAFPEVA